jgi:hypothetical protein
MHINYQDPCEKAQLLRNPPCPNLWKINFLHHFVTRHSFEWPVTMSSSWDQYDGWPGQIVVLISFPL